MRTSLFEIYKIGIGPSSSHTVGPMRAAADFVAILGNQGSLMNVSRVQVDLYGSLALTGKGHGTDRAILLGLTGEQPDTVDPDLIESRLAVLRETSTVPLRGVVPVTFNEGSDLVFHCDETLRRHSNGMQLRAFGTQGQVLRQEIYYSIGGGFILREGADAAGETRTAVPYSFANTEELLSIGAQTKLAIWQIILENEKTWHAESQIRNYLDRVWKVMQECVKRGLETEGVLPGGLNVRRRASRLAKKISARPSAEPLSATDWVNVYAMAVNEENAAGGRVVTAPTNGAAGIVPAVGHYYMEFIPDASPQGLFRYLLTAGAIAILFKENASISGAEVGCQGEVGVACSMAAGGLAAALGGNNRQVECAAEIGMEHNLGMTCDPIGGLVQIPCIERNAMGAVKAINACRLAMDEGGEHRVSLDQVIKTMYETGKDMQARYKETSLGGLATLNIIEC